MNRFTASTLLSLSVLSTPLLNAQETVELNSQFSHLAKNLKPGGPHYSVTYVEGDFADTLKSLDELIQQAVKPELEAALLGEDSDKAKEGLEFLENYSTSKFLGKLGIGQIAAFGSSVTPIEDDFWHNRKYFSYADKRKGLIRVLGDETTPWQSPLYAPAEADLVLETALNAKFILPLVRDILKGAPEDGMAKFDKRLAEPLFPGSRFSIEEAMNQTSVQASIALTLDTTKEWSPEPGVTLPGFTAAGRVQGLKPYWPLIEKQLSSKLPRTEKDGLILFVIPQKIPAPFGEIQPHIIYDSAKDVLWVQMNGSPLDAVADVDGRLSQNAEFKTALTDIPEKGTSLIYISTEMQNEAVKLFKAAVKKESQTAIGAHEKMLIELIFGSLTSSKPIALALASEEDGLLMALNSQFALKGSSNLSSIFLVSIFSGAAITAYDGFQRKAEIERLMNDPDAVPAPANPEKAPLSE